MWLPAPSHLGHAGKQVTTGWLICPHHPQICSSREVDELLAEIQKAQSLRDHVQALHPNAPCEEPTGAMQEVGAESRSSDLPGGVEASHLSLEGAAARPPKVE